MAHRPYLKPFRSLPALGTLTAIAMRKTGSGQNTSSPSALGNALETLSHVEGQALKIYTKTGDEGDTTLFGGGRVPKDHPRVAAYGDVDELNSALGVVRATSPTGFYDALLEAVQRDLFSIGGHLATPDPARVAKALEKADLSPARVVQFEQVMDEAEQELAPLRSFVLPAGTPKSAGLHLARTVCRRAERSVVHLAHDNEVPPLFIVYLNRLSDLLFTLARLANHREGVRDIAW
jgi:cob(I)alamin adenosyltransferase